MASSKALFLVCLNLVFFTLVSSSYLPVPSGDQDGGHNGGNDGGHHGGNDGGHHGGSDGGHNGGDNGSHNGDHDGGSSPSNGGKCPKDALKIQACATVLEGLNGGGLAHVVLGQQRPKCCSLLDGLVGLDAAACLCTTLTVDVLDIIHLKVPVNLSVLLNFCGKAGVPSDYQCPKY